MTTLPKRRFFAVIHTLTGEGGVDHVVNQTAVARECGADGVFIIPDYEKGRDKKATTSDQLAYLAVLREKFPNFLIGVNFLLSLEGMASQIYKLQPNLLQTDRSSAAPIDKSQLSNTEFFCGLAFKYQLNETLQGEELRKHCERVAAVCDVPTTSGAATGISASLQKVREIRSYLSPDKRLGLASGVTHGNVQEFLQAGVTDFLVATSLIKYMNEFDFDILDPFKVSRMAVLVHSFEEEV